MSIDRALNITEDLLRLIKDYKMLKMQHFLGINSAMDLNSSESIKSETILSQYPVVDLKEILVNNSGIIQGPDDQSLYKEYHSHEGLPLIRSEYLADLRLRVDEYQYLREDIRYALPGYVVQGADILMVQKGEYAGASAIVPIFHEDGILGENCIRIRVNPDLCETFYLLNVLHYYYRAGLLHTMLENSSGKITTFSISELAVPLLPRKEQKNITDSLLALSGAMAAQETYRDEMLKLKNIIDTLQQEMRL